MSFDHSKSTLTQIKDRRWTIRAHVDTDPDVLKARKAYYARFKDEMDAMDKREAELKTKKHKADPLREAISHPEIDNAIKRLTAGVNYSGKLYAVYFNPYTKRGIIGKTAGSCWSGRGQPQSYVAPERWLVELTRTDKDDTGIYYKNAILVKEVSGRFPKQTDQNWRAWCDGNPIPKEQL